MPWVLFSLLVRRSMTFGCYYARGVMGQFLHFLLQWWQSWKWSLMLCYYPIDLTIQNQGEETVSGLIVLVSKRLVANRSLFLQNWKCYSSFRLTWDSVDKVEIDRLVIWETNQWDPLNCSVTWDNRGADGLAAFNLPWESNWFSNGIKYSLTMQYGICADRVERQSGVVRIDMTTQYRCMKICRGTTF